MARNTIKRDRIQARVDSATKRVLERGIARESVALSPADWDAFYAALINPPKPNAKLIEAVRWYDSLKH